MSMSAPVGSISFVCDLCSRGIPHTHGTLHAGGVFSVDASQFWSLYHQRLTNAVFEEADGGAVFPAMNLGASICRFHWMHLTKMALDAHTRSPTLSVEERMGKQGFTFFHTFWMHQLKADRPFSADARYTVEEVEEVLA